MASRFTALLIALLAAMALAVPAAEAIQAVPPVTIAVNTTADESTPGDGLTSLREAIAQADADSGSNTYDIAVPAGTYHLGADGELDLTYTHGHVSLNGAGARSTIITADGSHRVLNVGSGASATIAGLTITGGQAPATAAGGGILNFGSLTIQAATIAGNSADFGGGIANFGALVISSSTLSGNSAGVGAASGPSPQPTWIGGGAIYNNASFALTNDTLDGNTASGTDTIGGFGGAIHNDSGAGSMSITFTTFAHNRALGHGAAGLDIATTGSASIPANDNLFASEPVGGAPAGDPHNCAGSNDLYGASGDDSLDTGSSCLGVGHTGIDPKLQPLADNGGPTDTDALSGGSPAIHATGDCSGLDVTSDQRGLPRDTSGTTCDIGAYQLQSGNDLGVAIGASPNPVVSGSNVTYTITASASGPAGDATQPTVSDALPAGTTLVSATPSQGSCSGTTTVTCALGSVHNGSSATVTLVVKTGATGALSDTATVSGPRPETSSSNNSATTTVNVVPPPAGQAGSTNTNTNTNTNPAAITALTLSPRSFHAAASGPSAAAATGARVTYRLSHASTVVFTVERQAKGVRKGRKCVAPSRRTHGKSCVRYVRVRGSFSLQGNAGLNSFHFSGRIGGRKLAPGAYRLVATPAGAPPQRISFKIVR